jgi:hypothetical protein
MFRRGIVWTLGVSVLVAAAAGSAGAQIRRAPVSSGVGEDYHVEASINFWNPTPDIVVTSESLGIPGTEIDAVDDLGFEKKMFTDFKVTLKATKRFKLRLGYTPIKYTAQATLQRNIIFNGQLYSVGLPVDTELEWHQWRGGIQFDVVSVDRGFLGFIVEAKFTDFRVDLASPLVSEFTDVKAPIPTVGGIGRVYVAENFAITGELTGLSLTIDGDEGRYFDFDLNGAYYFTPNFGAQGGFRRLSLHYTVDQDTGDLKLSGIYFGGVVRF